MGQLGGVGDDVVMLLGRGGLEVAEAQPPGELPDLLQTAVRRTGIGRKNQGRPLEQLRERKFVSRPLNTRHRVSADEIEPAFLGYLFQRSADHALDAAAVHNQPLFAEVLLMLCDIGHRGLRVQGDDNQTALRKPLRREGGGNHTLIQRTAEDRAVGVIAVEGTVRICVDGLGHTAADQAQAHDPYCFYHGSLLHCGLACGERAVSIGPDSLHLLHHVCKLLRTQALGTVA